MARKVAKPIGSHRPIEAAYWRMKDRLPDPSTLSIRKQMCLAYIEWRVRHLEDLKRIWVDLAVEFRKKEGRVGMKRTRLEKLARQHFTQRRMFVKNSRSREAATEFARKQFEEGTGIHSPEQIALKSERSKKQMQRLIAENRKPGTLDWVITRQSDGAVFRYRNLSMFCRENNINYRNLHVTAIHPWWAFGYRARKFDPVTDSEIPWLHELE